LAIELADAPRKTFFALLLATLLFRFWLASAMPITGDEAYFIWWGKVPDWGFYDHPPMVGWLLAGLLSVSDTAWWLRLPALLLPGALALGTARALRRRGDAVAWGGAVLVLLAPANVWNIFITTDTPLIFFSFFSALAFLRAARDDDRRYYALAGLLLAGAALSKYFAALLGFAYLLHVLIRPSRRKWAGLLWCYAGVIPALGLMAWWNAGHCWPNYMFNFVNRHADAGWSLRTPMLYAAMLLYLLTPPVLWLLAKRRAALATHWAIAEGRALLLVAFVPLILFAGLSLLKLIGLHWVLSFLPFVFILLVQSIETITLHRLMKFFIGFAALHVVAILAVAQFPLETWQRTRLYDGIVLTFESQKLLEQLEPYAQDFAFASDGYSGAATLGYHARRHFLVFGEASSHARHDDILTDFRTLDRKNILILRMSPPQPGYYEAYFREVETQRFSVRGASFYRVLGRGFDFTAYRDRVLAKVRDKYYAIPAWLPQNGCYFCERYFPEMVCRK